MLFREIVTVYCDNTEHAYTLRGQNSESQYVKAGGTYSNRLALKGCETTRIPHFLNPRVTLRLEGLSNNFVALVRERTIPT
jgi:hypothetical protein